MPGFLGYISKTNKNYKLPDASKNNKQLARREIVIKNFKVIHTPNKKFLEDKLFEENQKIFIITEGVLVNSNDLQKRFSETNLFDTLYKMYQKLGAEFINELRGSFSGILYDKTKDKLIVFTNHIGDKQVFYHTLDDGSVVFGSDINYIHNFLKVNSITYDINIDACYFLLTLGWMFRENTMFKDIFKLMPGHYLTITGNRHKITRYHQLDNTPNYNLTEDEIINNVDSLFRKAIKRAFDKDKQYGYKHLVTLSGGLDSRMTTWIANNMGYGNNIINMTFSQSNYLDQTIANKIATDLRHEWIFKSLDNGICLKNVEDMVKISAGNFVASGSCHVESFINLINTNKFGIVHTGQLGDVILGGFYGTLDKNKPCSFSEKAISKKLIHKLPKLDTNKLYESSEIFNFYVRGFLGINQGLLVYQQNMESYSPFYDLDFIEYCLKIPIEKRYAHKIYFKWILQKYPNAAKYKWEQIKSHITTKQIKIRSTFVPLNQVFPFLFNAVATRFLADRFQYKSSYHMNPHEYWYNTNKDLKNSMDKYYNENINLIDFNSNLKEDCIMLYNSGNVREKNQVLTLLAVLKLYF